MKVVKVYGALRKRLGQCRFEFDVATPAQAIKALCVNFPGLEKWLIDSEQDGVGYRVTIGREHVTDDLSRLVMPWSEKEVFSITPVVAGAGRGAGQIFLGLAIIGLSMGVGAIASAGVTLGGFAGIGTVGTAFASIGLSIALSGIATSISPQPEPSSLDESVQLESFTFSNVVNTSKQGLPVPIAYGRVFAGSAVLSSSLDVDQKQA
jgi:predicted phage tail protein